jgi:uncharacterized membrane-anchored protein
MTAPIRILIVAGLLTAALVYMIADRFSLLNSGRVITLKVIPVDPTDMFRGDYVILSYKISRLDLNIIGGDDDLDGAQMVYVTLAQSTEGEWTAIAANKTMPKVSDPQFVLRGSVTSSYKESEGTAAPTITVAYGIESFFVPQGTGRPIEDQRNADKVTVDVVVASDGRTAIKALKVDGNEVYSETLF